MTQDPWLEAHSYLRPVAEPVRAGRSTRRPAIEIFDARMPDWEDYRAGFSRGCPAARRARAALLISSRAAEWRRRYSVDSPPSLAPMARGRRPALASGTAVHTVPDRKRSVVDFVLGDETITPRPPVCCGYVGLDGDIAVPAARREGLRRPGETRTLASPELPDMRDRCRRWLNWSAPTPGVSGLLSCGCCGTRWQYKRTGCPFCETDAQRLASVIHRGRAEVAHRPLRIVQGLSQDLRRQGATKRSCSRTGRHCIST